MIPAFASYSKNPLLLTSALLFAGAIALLLITVGLLLNTVVYNPEASLLTSSASNTAQRVNASSISDRNFFGLLPSGSEITESLDLPETELALILRGAFAESDQDKSGAIIEDENTRIANHYRVGEELPGNATLQAVHANRVVLTRNGLLETLYFPDMADHAGIGANKIRSVSGAGSSAGGAPENEDARKRREAIRERIKQLRNR